MPAPIKRNEALKPLSHDHHQALLLCWKIRMGISKGIEISRISGYTAWFFENYLSPHFAVEEKYLFPLIGNEHGLVKQALEDHKNLRTLFIGHPDKAALIKIEALLEKHVRFEERILFNEIQQVSNPDVLARVMEAHNFIGEPAEPWDDEFWN